MNTLLLLRVSLAVTALAAIGCDRDDDPIAPTPERTGAVAGIVQLMDTTQLGQFDLYHAGVTVRIDGTSHVATSDSTGRWLISGVPAGVYTFELSKPGYTRDYLVRQQVVGRDTAFVWPRNQPNGGTFTLQLAPRHRIDSLSVRILPAGGASPSVLRIDGSISPKLQGPFITAFLGTTSSVSQRWGTYRYVWQVGSGQVGRIAAEIDLATLRKSGFAPGSTVYLIAYPGGGMKDYDWFSDRWYFKDLVDEPTGVVSVVLP